MMPPREVTIAGERFPPYRLVVGEPPGLPQLAGLEAAGVTTEARYDITPGPENAPDVTDTVYVRVAGEVFAVEAGHEVRVGEGLRLDSVGRAWAGGEGAVVAVAVTPARATGDVVQARWLAPPERGLANPGA